MLIIQSRLMKDGHILLPWVLCYHILGFLIFEGWQVDLHSEIPSCMCQSVATPRCSCHFSVHRSLIASAIRTPIQRSVWATGKHLGIPSVPCHLCCLPLPPTCQAWVLPHLCMWAWTLSFLPTSLLNTPWSQSYIQSLTLQAVAEGWVAPLDPWGCPGPLAFIFFSMMASTIAWEPACMVLMVASTCTVILA